MIDYDREILEYKDESKVYLDTEGTEFYFYFYI
jgi:hypothetical protein